MSELYPDGLLTLVDQQAGGLQSIIDDLAYRSRMPAKAAPSIV